MNKINGQKAKSNENENGLSELRAAMNEKEKEMGILIKTITGSK